MDLGLEGRVALVMATSSGLGRAVATELAREGASVMISSRNEDALGRFSEYLYQNERFR
ncbi:MAG TPA: SDR family NAD(P)-dependent oxidoreductase [Rubrobacteraceae bacterium]|nr:SDR family NAD(P)-dependent oxidoreductase [Rubrobacteraceae bacterium]